MSGTAQRARRRSPIRVLHLITNLEMGGAEMMLLKLLSGMDSSQFSSSVVSMISKQGIGSRIEKLGIPVTALGFRRGAVPLRGWGPLLDLVRRDQPDIIQTWMYHADLAGLLWARLLRIPHLVWNIRHSNLDPGHDSRMTRWVAAACARFSRQPDAIIVNSHAGRTVHEGLGYASRRWEVIPNGFDLDRYRPDRDARQSVRRELCIEGSTPLVGLFARFHPMKDHETFLEAARILGERRPGTRFLLAGTGTGPENSELNAAIEARGLGDSVHRLGIREDVPRLMAALDVLVSSSSSGEGFSNSIGEAMACGVPCVVTDVGDSARIVGQTGVVVPPRDPAALAAGCDRLLGATATARQSIGALARSRVAKRYSIQTVVARYEGLYRELTGGNPCADS